MQVDGERVRRGVPPAVVWIRRIISFGPEGVAKLSQAHGPFQISPSTPLKHLFAVWEKLNAREIPFAEYFYAKYPFNEPSPDPLPGTGVNEPYHLRPEHTPESVGLSNGCIIYVRMLVILPEPPKEPPQRLKEKERGARVFDGDWW
ncbi:hypothetical protein IAT40_003715 [Kwoniella sp. CBS 6097]